MLFSMSTYVVNLSIFYASIEQTVQRAIYNSNLWWSSSKRL